MVIREVPKQDNQSLEHATHGKGFSKKRQEPKHGDSSTALASVAESQASTFPARDAGVTAGSNELSTKQWRMRSGAADVKVNDEKHELDQILECP